MTPADLPILVWPEFVLNLQDALLETGWPDDPLYLVGGAVRDSYLRRAIEDIDLVTAGSGIRWARTIANRLGGAFFPLDESRDVGRALIQEGDKQLIIDVARYRGADLEADLRDRDFTVNAMAVDVRGDLNVIIDPVDGLHDLRERRLRLCSPDAIARDPVRGLRAVRQSVQFGFRIEAETLVAVRAGAVELGRVSNERVRDEIIKMLALPRPFTAMRIAQSVGLLAAAFPMLTPPIATDIGLRTMERLSEIIVAISPKRTDATAAQFSLGMMVMALDRYRTQLNAHLAQVWPDERSYPALLMLRALLLNGNSEMLEAVGKHLRLSSAEMERLIAMQPSALLDLPNEDLTPLIQHRFWRRYGDAGVDTLLFGLATALTTQNFQAEQDAWLRLLERARTLLFAYYEAYNTVVAPTPFVSGTDLMRALALRSGPLIGELIEHLREAQVKGEITSPETALAFARQYIETRNKV